MHIPQMHVWFRQYAQQMGLQNVRAILPEQIDVLINTSISDTVNDIIRQSITLTDDRTPNDSSKVGQINALRTLYKTIDLDFSNQIQFDADSAGGRWYCNNFADKEQVVKTIYTYETIVTINEQNRKITEVITMFSNGAEPTIVTTEEITEEEIKDRTLVDVSNETSESSCVVPMLYLIDLSIRYTRNGNKFTTYYPVRLIDDIYLADTLNDFILKPRVRTPIAVVTNNRLEVYLGDDFNSGNGLLNLETITPAQLRVSYLAKPAIVSYKSDFGGIDVDCDLPEALHIDILKHAVDLYRISVSGALNANQRQMPRQEQANRGYNSDVSNNYQ